MKTWHLVANSANKNEVEEPFFLAAFDEVFVDESLGEFEGDTDAGEVAKLCRAAIIVALGVNNSDGIWQIIGTFVVVGDDGVNMVVREIGNNIMVARAAVDGNDKIDVMVEGLFN